VRVALCTFGSAGDLFPLVPVAHDLQAGGHEVVFVVPPSLGLYLRAIGLPTQTIGDGSEMRFGKDDALFDLRADGWNSFGHVFDHYVAPTLEADVGLMEAFLERWRPDVIATTTYAAAARVAGLRQGVRTVSLSIYPQFAGPRPESASGGAYAQGVLRAAGALVGSVSPETIAYGCGPGSALLHDGALLGPSTEVCLGHPNWEHLPVVDDDRARADAWLQVQDGDGVVVTMGSFIGTRVGLLERLTEAAASVGRPLLVLNAPARPRDHLRSHPATEAVGYLPVSDLAPHVAAVVHHGGIGTTFSVLRAGCPAAVAPQAFDQPFNAALVEQRGVGRAVTEHGLPVALAAVLDGECGRRASHVAATLIEPASAARAAARFVLESPGLGATLGHAP